MIPTADITPDNVVRSLASGATFGLADEFSAMMDAATHGVLGRGATGDTYGQRYEQNLAKERGQDKVFAEQHPYVDAAGKIAGGIGGAIATLPAAATSIGPSALGNVAKMTGIGAGLGAAQGFGEGEGTVDRLGRAALGGAVGGTLGAAARPLAAVGRSIGESAPGRLVGDYVTGPIANIFSQGAESTAGNAALQRLATQLQRARMTPEAAGTRLGQLGDQAMIADVNPQLLSSAVGAKVLPGETRSIAEQNLLSRDREAGNRLVGAFESGQSPPSTFQALQGMDANRRAVGEQAYGGMRQAGLAETPELEALKKIPDIQAAIKAVETDAANKGIALEPIDVMHRVKQQLNLNADAAFQSGKPVNKADVGDLANRWESAFWQANPQARAADTAYAQAKSLPEVMQAGRNFLRKGTTEAATDASAPALADLLMGANPQQRAAAQLGATNAARETALEGTRPARALAQRIDESAPVQSKLTELYGPEQAQKIMRQAEAEGVFANTSNKLLRGSQTAEKTSDALDSMSNVGIRATPGGGLVPRVTESLGAFTRWVRSPNEAVRNEIGRMTINPNAKENAKTLELLAALLQQRANAGRGTAGIASAAGGQAGGF